MKNRIWARALIAIWGMWLTAALSEPAGLHTCPMHGSHSAHVHTANAPSTSAAHHTSAPSDQAKATCTCLGLCCGASVAAPRVVMEIADGALVWKPARDFARSSTPDFQRPHALPFANGPPAAI